MSENGPVWLTYHEPSASGHRAIFASLDLAKRSCEANVQEWKSGNLWEGEDEPAPVLHAPAWTLEPDPGLPAAILPRVPEDKYVWVGRYCDDQPTWLFRIRREDVIGQCAWVGPDFDRTCLQPERSSRPGKQDQP